MHGSVSRWTLADSHDRPIHGNTHEPASSPRGCVLLLHGFKGYKDYGFIPVLANELCAQGWAVHRFNFSTSGMTHAIETFAHPDHFEQDTWNRQVADVHRVLAAINGNELPGADLPTVLIGHSRGGVTALLTSGRTALEAPKKLSPFAGVVTINAPGSCDKVSDSKRELLLTTGTLEIESARTGQILRIGRAWLQEQLDDPAAHDLPTLARLSADSAPLLLLAGTDDQTVTLAESAALAQHAGVVPVELPGGNHVLNEPNPADLAGPRHPVMQQALDAISDWLRGL